MKSNAQRFNFRPDLLSVVDGNTDAAVLLSYCKERQEMENLDSEPGGSVYWPMSDMGSATGLSRRRMDSARAVLEKSGVVTNRRGWQSRLEFHIDLALLDQHISSAKPEAAATEEIPMNRELLDFAGRNIHAALMLSYAMRRQKHADETQPPEKFGIYWPMRQQEWFRLLGLTRRKQESARNVLLKTGCWKERQWGWPAHNEFHLDLDQLATILPAASGLTDVKMEGPRIESLLKSPAQTTYTH